MSHESHVSSEEITVTQPFTSETIAAKTREAYNMGVRLLISYGEYAVVSDMDKVRKHGSGNITVHKRTPNARIKTRDGEVCLANVEQELRMTEKGFRPTGNIQINLSPVLYPDTARERTRVPSKAFIVTQNPLLNPVDTPFATERLHTIQHMFAAMDHYFEGRHDYKGPVKAA